MLPGRFGGRFEGAGGAIGPGGIGGGAPGRPMPGGIGGCGPPGYGGGAI